MICSKEMQELINTLMDSDDTFAVFQTAFDEIGKKYGIAKLVYKLTVPANPFTTNGEEREAVAYVQENAVSGQEAMYVKKVLTGEKGIAFFEVYRTIHEKEFTKEEIADIDSVLNVIIFHAARWRMINKIYDLQYYDGMTGLVNAGGFLTYIDSLIEKKELAKYNAYYFNLSRFSLVNKRFGSAETDKIIVRYTEAIRDFLEPGEILGRLGGDNFTALVLKERTEAFLEFLSGVIIHGKVGERDEPVKISAVAGILELDESIVDNSCVLNDAAMALNVAKHILKKPFMFASEQMRAKGFMDKQVASSFMEGLYKDEFKVYYQPKVTGTDYRIAGGEALSRWIKDGVMMQPMQFIPVIEQNGMICLLDFYVLEQVCKDITGWLEKGMKVGRMSVNFSRKNLSNPNLVENIMDILKKYDMAGRYIEIELTETVDQVEADLLSEFIKRMKYHNVAVSIDDFGTGYSSLNMLRSFAVDVLKIDKSFIDNLDERNKTVLSNIVHMAQELDMQVVAEGVETKEQAQYLRDIGCHLLQGFLFDKPLPKTEFEEKMENGMYQI